MDVAQVAMPDAHDDDDVVTNDKATLNDPYALFVSSYFVVAVLVVALPKHR